MKKIRSAPKLKRTYAHFNRQFFGNRLPKNTIVYWDKAAHRNGDLGWAVDEEIFLTREGTKWNIHTRVPTTIGISPWLRFSTKLTQLVLLHEMVHIELYPKHDGYSKHGKKFQNGMMRLARKGYLKGLW